MEKSTEKIKNKLKAVPGYVWILSAIMIAGIFLRTYHFSDWLQFSPDQARDTMVVSDAVNGISPLPLLGPVAGGTNFHLGPIFYYFQFISASIFGNAPDKMAYPDLIFSILAIPLLFFFLKRYFSNNISLALTALMSFSYFAIVNSRFASNPNSIPFFILLFLYALLEMMDEKNRKKYLWPVLLGAAIGVGVQLHTLLLLVLPIMATTVLIYLLAKNKVVWKNALLVVLVAVFLNVPQLISEVRTSGDNAKNFFTGAGEQSNSPGETVKNIGRIAACQVQFNAHMVSSFENIEQCGDIFLTKKHDIKKYRFTPGNFDTKSTFIAGMALSVLFSLGGYLLLGYYSKKESDKAKKNFLNLIIMLNIISFVFFIPVASHITLRYYIILFPMPFVILGLWLKFITEKYPKIEYGALICVVTIFSLLSLAVDVKAAGLYLRGQANDGDNSIFGETRLMADYVIANAGDQKNVYMSGERVYSKRFFMPLVYFTKEAGLNLALFESVADVRPGMRVFSVVKSSSKKYAVGEQISGRTIEGVRRFNNITIFVLRTN